jgi:hypothetical protein
MGVETSEIRAPERGVNLPDSSFAPIWQVGLLPVASFQLPVASWGCGGAKSDEGLENGFSR